MRRTVGRDPSTDAPRTRTNPLPGTGWWPAVAALLLVGGSALLLVAGSAAAHSGQGGGLDGPALEAEAYDAPDGACDPDFDGEHTEVKEHANASGGAFAFAPHSGCGFHFAAVDFQDDAVFRTLRAHDANCGPAWGHPYSMEVRVILEETGPYDEPETVASAEVQFDCEDPGFRTVAFDETRRIPEGNHDIRIEYEVQGSAPYWINVRLDRATVEFLPPEPEAQVSEEVAVEADPAPGENLTSPAVVAPASCQAGPGLEDVCREPTNVSTPPVDETCDPAGLACAGPAPSAEVAQADPLCEAAPTACTEEQQVVDERTLVEAGTVPAVSQPVAGADVTVNDTDVDVSPTPGEGEAVEETTVEAPFPPAEGGVPVTVCPGGCIVPTPVEIQAETGVSVEVGVGGDRVASHAAGAGTALP